MRPVISADQMRQIDRLTNQEYAIPYELLMEAAAAACLQSIRSHLSGQLIGKKALILCGPGSNGGDGASLARALSCVGVHSDVVLFGRLEDTRGEARTNFEIVRRLARFEAGSAQLPSPLSFVECDGVTAWEEIARPAGTYNIIVDALFGTGLSRPLQGVYLQVIEHLEMIREARERSSTVKPLILSVDIPSGLNADREQPIGAAVQADITVTFTAPKPANVLPPASHFNGDVVVADIGSPPSLLAATKPLLFVTEENDAREWLVRTRYTKESYKNTHGHALIIAGSRGYTGAAALCGNAAMRSGAGLVTIATPASAETSVAARTVPEVITVALAETDRGAISEEAIDHVLSLATKATVIAIGPGLDAEDERTRQFVRTVVEQRITPVVIDADGLNCLAPWPETLLGTQEHPLVLTPHPGEMRRIIGTTDRLALSDRVAAVRDFATRHDLILLLKGSRSLIAAPDGRVFVNPTGNAGLGTAGAGDTLTGIITGFISQTVAALKNQSDVLCATIAALYIGGLAGDLAAQKIGMRTMIASDIREYLSSAIRLLDPEGETP